MATISGVAIVVSSGAGGGTVAGEEVLIGGRATIGVGIGIDRPTPATTRMLPCSVRGCVIPGSKASQLSPKMAITRVMPTSQFIGNVSRCKGAPAPFSTGAVGQR